MTQSIARRVSLLLILGVVFSVPVAPARLSAQTTIAAPTIDTITAADGMLSIEWSAPAGAAGITAYDLRYIETSADETVDSNWTEVQDIWVETGDLSYWLRDLTNGVGYDVQLRAATATVNGDWSATATGTPMNRAPTFPSSTAERFIAENSPAGTAVGEAVVASDAEDALLAYSLSGTDSDAFSIDADGQLRVAQGTVLDHETKSEHNLIVTATDSAGASAASEVKVRVTDVYDPSIVLIVADEGGTEIFGAYGSTQYRTPRIDEIAADGVRFTHAYSKPGTTPSRIALLTGRSNVRNYVDARTLLPGQHTIAKQFGDAGYATSIAGKWQLQGRQNYVTGVAASATGFDTYCLWYSEISDSRYWDPSFECDGEIIDLTADDYGPDKLVTFLQEFMEANQNRPFFAYYSMLLPHDPFDSLPPVSQCADANDDQCVFEDMVTYMDRNVGLIYDKIKALGLLDNTVLMFTSDNGTPPSKVSNLGGVAIHGDKGMPTDGGTHVPLIVLAPGVEAGRVIDDLIDFTDILPTLADAADLTIPATVALDGVSFWDRVQNEPGSPREWIYTYYFPEPYALSFVSPRTHPPVAYVRNKRFKLYSSGDLFDLTSDPHEVHPLAAEDTDSQADRLALQAVLDAMPTRAQEIRWSHVLPSATTTNTRPRWRPVLRTATVNRFELILTYAGGLDTDANPGAQAFSVKVAGAGRQVTTVSLTNAAVNLTLSSPVAVGDTVTVSYTPPAMKPLRSRVQASGNAAAALTDEPVTNETRNGPPTFPSSETGKRVVAEDITVGRDIGGHFVAEDFENDPLTYSISGDDAAAFDIDSSSGQLRTAQEFDFEEKQSYSFTISVHDGKDAEGNDDETIDASLEATVTVVDVNEPPSIDGPETVSIEEMGSRDVVTLRAQDPEGDAYIWQELAGSDHAAFGFSNGRLSFVAAPDFERPTDNDADNDYVVTVLASDGEHIGELEITISVTNKEEPGTVRLSSAQPHLETDLSATLSDPDIVSSAPQWVWERSLNQRDWTEVSTSAGGTTSVYRPQSADLQHVLRVRATYEDGEGSGKSAQATSSFKVQPAPPTNQSPTFPQTSFTRSVAENSKEDAPVGARVVATDPENQPLTLRLSGSDADSFKIDNSGQIRVGQHVLLDHEEGISYFVTVTASDPSNATASAFVTISVDDVNEPPLAVADVVTTSEEVATLIDVLANDSDPDAKDNPLGERLTLTLRDLPAHGTVSIGPEQMISYTPELNFSERDSFGYRISDGQFSSTSRVVIEVVPVNDPPQFRGSTFQRQLAQDATSGSKVGAPIRAVDVDGDQLTFHLEGDDAPSFDIDGDSGQIRLGAGTVLDIENRPEYTVTVVANDPYGASARVDVTIAVVEQVHQQSSGGGGGGGGGPPPVPIPSDEDFDWNVTRDLETLDRDNDMPTGVWSDGITIWIVENSAGGADHVFAYNLQIGERDVERGLVLDRRNRFSHGIWSDRQVLWIADSGQDKLFAYDRRTGDRLEQRDVELHERNRDPRGIWSDGEVIYVLDSVKDALFVYDLETGKLQAEYALDKLNRSPRGIWSDGVTIWVSDDGAKRLFAYEFDEGALVRNEDLEFTFRSLLKAGNGDARGIWSDGDIMYVVDEQDAKVYTYNIPDATIALLGSLSLTGLEIGTFLPNLLDYTTTAAQELPTTTVLAEPTHERATVAVEPDDADGDLENGHQVKLQTETTITVTVRSEDGSRTKSYQVLVRKPPCLEGLTDQRLSEVVFVGGGIGELETCARGFDVDALYHQRDGVWTVLVLSQSVPGFLSQPFRTRFVEGLPAGESLIAARLGQAPNAVDIWESS